MRWEAPFGIVSSRVGTYHRTSAVGVGWGSGARASGKNRSSWSWHLCSEERFLTLGLWFVTATSPVHSVDVGSHHTDPKCSGALWVLWLVWE